MSEPREAYAVGDSGGHLEKRDPGQDQAESLNQESSIDIELTQELRGELLHPATWSSILGLCAQTMKLAVALVDADGQMVGECHNAQPIWSLARLAQPAPAGDCLFCLETARYCTARARAIEKRALALAHDQAGFAHVVYPLILGGQVVGTLLAGQVLDRYAEPLPLQRFTAANLGPVPSRGPHRHGESFRLWRTAGRAWPNSAAGPLWRHAGKAVY